MLFLLGVTRLAYNLNEISEHYNDWIERYGQKSTKMPQRWNSSPIYDPKILFTNRAMSILYPYDALTSCKIQKKLMSCLRDIQRQTDKRTDQRPNKRTDQPTNMADYLGPLWINWGQN